MKPKEAEKLQPLTQMRISRRCDACGREIRKRHGHTLAPLAYAEYGTGRVFCPECARRPPE